MFKIILIFGVHEGVFCVFPQWTNIRAVSRWQLPAAKQLTLSSTLTVSKTLCSSASSCTLTTLFQVEYYITSHLCFAVNSPDFKAGVMALANLLKIQRHDDYLVMLKVELSSRSLL